MLSIVYLALLVASPCSATASCESSSGESCHVDTSHGDVANLLQYPVHVHDHSTSKDDGEDEHPARKSGSSSCVKAPLCVEPSQACLPFSAIVRSNRSECQEYQEFCGVSIYKLPVTGLKISLPLITPAQLTSLYSRAYNGQADLEGGPLNWRPTQQAAMVLKQPSVKDRTGLTIVEMGCAAGYTLYNVRHLASNGGKLICFEPDSDYAQALASTFQKAKVVESDLNTEHRHEFFDGDRLAPSSVDVFMSSQTVEHLADPCPWLSALHTILKPGGLVFTEVPMEYNNPGDWGQFHMMWFNGETWANMMLQAGFEQVEVTTVQPPITGWGVAVRSIFRKPWH